MKNIQTISILILVLFFSSCSTVVSLKTRNEKQDVALNTKNYKQLNGTFLNNPVKTRGASQTVLSGIGKDKLWEQKGDFVTFSSINKRKIKYSLYAADSILINNGTLKGKYKDGYFKIRPQWKKELDLGIFIWTIEDHTTYIGLTKENNLIIVRAEPVWYVFAMVIPVWAGGQNGQNDGEYQRTK